MDWGPDNICYQISWGNSLHLVLKKDHSDLFYTLWDKFHIYKVFPWQYVLYNNTLLTSMYQCTINGNHNVHNYIVLGKYNV